MPNPGHASGKRGERRVYAKLRSLKLSVGKLQRNAPGADLVALSRDCQKMWSVQVKFTRSRYWQLGAHPKKIQSPVHVYVFLKKCKNGRIEEFVVPSRIVCRLMNFHPDDLPSNRYSIRDEYVAKFKDRWSVFS
jgi:hypothetical protein